MRFQSKTSVFKFLRRSVDVALDNLLLNIVIKTHSRVVSDCVSKTLNVTYIDNFFMIEIFVKSLDS